MKNISIGDLKFSEYNPRKIHGANFERLKKSIQEHGFVVPNTVNTHPGRELVIIAGHMRTRAAQELGYTEVPCYLVNVDPNKEKMLNIALNSQDLQGRFDEGKLAEIVYNLTVEGADVTLTGFDDEKISLIVNEGVMRPPSTEPKEKKREKVKKGEIIFKCPECGHEWNDEITHKDDQT